MASGNGDDRPEITPLRSDRRKNLRSALLVLKVKLDTGNRTFFGYAKVISKSGMFISSVNPQQIGTEASIEFFLPDKTIVRCKCSVVWRREYDPKSQYEPGMGIRFLDLPEDIQARLDEWARKG